MQRRSHQRVHVPLYRHAGKCPQPVPSWPARSSMNGIRAPPRSCRGRRSGHWQKSVAADNPANELGSLKPSVDGVSVELAARWTGRLERLLDDKTIESGIVEDVGRGRRLRFKKKMCSSLWLKRAPADRQARW